MKCFALFQIFFLIFVYLSVFYLFIYLFTYLNQSYYISESFSYFPVDFEYIYNQIYK